MPCQTDYDPELEAFYRLKERGFDMEHYRSRHGLMRALLCKATHLLQKHALLDDEDLLRWHHMHEEEDRDRLAAEAAEQERLKALDAKAELRAATLAKLTAEEREALGIEG